MDKIKMQWPQNAVVSQKHICLSESDKIKQTHRHISFFTYTIGISLSTKRCFIYSGLLYICLSVYSDLSISPCLSEVDGLFLLLIYNIVASDNIAVHQRQTKCGDSQKYIFLQHIVVIQSFQLKFTMRNSGIDEK